MYLFLGSLRLVRDNLKPWVDDTMYEWILDGVCRVQGTRKGSIYALNMWVKGIALHLIHAYCKHVPIAALDCMIKERFNGLGLNSYNRIVRVPPQFSSQEFAAIRPIPLPWPCSSLPQDSCTLAIASPTSASPFFPTCRHMRTRSVPFGSISP